MIRQFFKIILNYYLFKISLVELLYCMLKLLVFFISKDGK